MDRQARGRRHNGSTEQRPCHAEGPAFSAARPCKSARPAECTNATTRSRPQWRNPAVRPWPASCYPLGRVSSSADSIGLPTRARNQGAGVMWVTRVRELPDGEELVWSEQVPSERELFTLDPRRAVLKTRAAALSTRRVATRPGREE